MHPPPSSIAAGVIATTAMAWCIYKLVRIRWPRSDHGDFPTMPSWPILGNLLDMMDPDLPQRLHEIGSPVWMSAPMFPGRALAFEDPELVKTFMLKSPTIFGFDPKIFDTETTITVYGKKHSRLQRAFRVALSKDAVERHAEGIHAIAERVLEKMVFACKYSTGINPLPFLQEYAFSVVCEVTLGSIPEHSRQMQAQFPTFLQIIKKVEASRFPFSFYAATEARYLGTKMHQILLTIVQSRRAFFHHLDPTADAMNSLLHFGATGATAHPPLSDTEIATSIRGFLAAGFDTTSQTLASALHCLLQEATPTDLARVAQDVREAGPAAPRLPRLDALLKECQRRFPMASLIPRLAKEDFMLAGVRVPKGTMLLPYRHRGFLRENADKFQVERFMGEEAYDKVTPMEFLPFGYGERGCPGQHMARLEMKMLLAILLGGEFVLKKGTKKSVVTVFPFVAAHPSVRLERV
ncbi:cytochrome P450 [Chytriomyces sp. MP71]|nr:cytochrome P450 [Chytriomyces sp. MP71]